MTFEKPKEQSWQADGDVSFQQMHALQKIVLMRVLQDLQLQQRDVGCSADLMRAVKLTQDAIAGAKSFEDQLSDENKTASERGQPSRLDLEAARSEILARLAKFLNPQGG